MRKILPSLVAAAATFALPLVALAKLNEYGMQERAMGMHGGAGILWMHLLGAVVLAVWGIVGVLAAIWLWQHVKPR